MLKQMLFLVWTTTLLGMAAGLAAWGILKLVDPQFIFMDDELSKYEWLSMGLGTVTIALTSFIGFIAYLFARYYMIGILRHKQGVWVFIQLFFIGLTLFDLVYLRYSRFAGEDAGFASFLVLPAVLSAVALGTAWLKVRMTNAGAFIPTLFFMIVLTSLEAIPAFQQNDALHMIYMLVVLLVCNAWQILVFHRLTGPSGASKDAAVAKG
jgi:KinB signaling pathway activation protein